MAKAKSKAKPKEKAKKAKRPAGAAAKSKTSAKAKPAAKSKVKAVKEKTLKLASNPLVAEVVAATLVAAAAALRNPRKARQLAESAAEDLGTAGKQLAAELGTAGKKVADRGNEFWNLALDVARRSVETVEAEAGVRKKSGKKKKK